MNLKLKSVFKTVGCAALLSALLVACGDDETTATTSGAGGASTTTTSAGGGMLVVPESYGFDSKFIEGQSAVAYSGQTMRHLLINDQKAYVGAMTAAIDGAAFQPADVATVVAALRYYHDFDSASSGSDAPLTTTNPELLHTSYDDVSTDKDLEGKLAGNDTSTDHADWSTAFMGWSDTSIAAEGGSVTSPSGLVSAFYGTLGKLAVDRVNGTIPNEPGTTTPLAAVYLTDTGLDLQQLIQKFLLMGVAYSQGTDDYLDDDVDGKGLLASNAQDEDKSYSLLGHAWDEGFGYFGAARDYALYTDDEVGGSGGRDDWQGFHDSNDDGKIDLRSEYNFGASVNAAKRDSGAMVATDFTADAFSGFVTGRAIIHAAGDTLTDAELSALRAERDKAVTAWENAIAATIIHYINDTIADTQAIDGSGYVYSDHAKHWSEMKGFALGLQFNPRSKISGTNFAQLHTLMRDAPVLSTATAQERTDYIADLEAARDLMETAYGFDASNVANW